MGPRFTVAGTVAEIMTKSSEVRQSRIRTMMQHAPSVKSRAELFAFAKARFGVSDTTANDYIDTMIKLVERMQKK